MCWGCKSGQRRVRRFSKPGDHEDEDAEGWDDGERKRAGSGVAPLLILVLCCSSFPNSITSSDPLPPPVQPYTQAGPPSSSLHAASLPSQSSVASTDSSSAPTTPTHSTPRLVVVAAVMAVMLVLKMQNLLHPPPRHPTMATSSDPPPDASRYWRGRGGRGGREVREGEERAVGRRASAGRGMDKGTGGGEKRRGVRRIKRCSRANISMYPAVCQKLREEILAHLGSHKRPTYDDIRDMKYMTAVINGKSSRMESVNSTTWPSPDPTEKPLYVPGGAKVPYSVFIMHRRTDLWGPDAEEFSSKRFLDERLKKYLLNNAFQFLPFNARSRICLGQQASASGRKGSDRFRPKMHLTMYTTVQMKEAEGV
ncbi:cytochrome P450 [Mycena rebaudengoi]|nr:cytochrome P450 [Mycena rebaudengoi]